MAIISVIADIDFDYCDMIFNVFERDFLDKISVDFKTQYLYSFVGGYGFINSISSAFDNSWAEMIRENQFADVPILFDFDVDNIDVGGASMTTMIDVWMSFADIDNCFRFYTFVFSTLKDCKCFVGKFGYMKNDYSICIYEILNSGKVRSLCGNYTINKLKFWIDGIGISKLYIKYLISLL